MRWLGRLCGVVVLLLAGLGTVGCVAVIVGTWVLYQGVAERVGGAFDKLDAGLRRVSAANQNVRRAVETARGDVASVGKESADLGGGGEKGRRAARAVRALVQQKAGPHLDELGGRLATLSDAGVAVSSLLQSFQESPLGQSPRIDPEQVQRRADEVRNLSAALRRLDAVVGDGDNEAGRREAATAASEVDARLQTCQEMVEGWQSDLDAAAEQLARLRARVVGWLTCAAVVVTLLALWMGAGQVSLFARALRWCRGR